MKHVLDMCSLQLSIAEWSTATRLQDDKNKKTALATAHAAYKLNWKVESGKWGCRKREKEGRGDCTVEGYMCFFLWTEVGSSSYTITDDKCYSVLQSITEYCSKVQYHTVTTERREKYMGCG